MRRHRFEGRQEPQMQDLRRQGPGPARPASGQQQYVTVGNCPKCGGKGRSLGNPCPKCDGEGYIHKPQKIEIEIPKGVDTGMRLRVPGQARCLPTAGLRGLFIVIHVREHELQAGRGGPPDGAGHHLRRSGPGGGDRGPHPVRFGHADHTGGHPTGDRFRLRGAGLDRTDSQGKGDQFVRVRLKVPKKLSDEQKERLRKFAELDT